MTLVENVKRHRHKQAVRLQDRANRAGNAYREALLRDRPEPDDARRVCRAMIVLGLTDRDFEADAWAVRRSKDLRATIDAGGHTEEDRLALCNELMHVTAMASRVYSFTHHWQVAPRLADFRRD